MTDKYEVCPNCRGEGVTFLRVETLYDDDDRGSLAERRCDRCNGLRVVEVAPDEDEDIDWGALSEQRYWNFVSDYSR